MGKSVRPRRLIALAAAYVVALQALLLPLSVAAGGPFAGSLCASAVAADGSSRRWVTTKAAPAPPVAACSAARRRFAGPPQVVAAFGVARFVTLTPPPAFALVVRLTARSPQIPRAPPAA